MRSRPFPKYRCLAITYWLLGVSVAFEMARKLYQTTISNGLTVSVLYDNLPQDFIDSRQHYMSC